MKRHNRNNGTESVWIGLSFLFSVWIWLSFLFCSVRFEEKLVGPRLPRRDPRRRWDHQPHAAGFGRKIVYKQRVTYTGVDERKEAETYLVTGRVGLPPERVTAAFWQDYGLSSTRIAYDLLGWVMAYIEQ